MTERASENKSGTASGIDNKELSEMSSNDAMNIVMNMGRIVAREVARRERSDDESVTVWDDAGSQIRYFIHDWEKAQEKKTRSAFVTGKIRIKKGLRDLKRRS